MFLVLKVVVVIVVYFVVVVVAAAAVYMAGVVAGINCGDGDVNSYVFVDGNTYVICILYVLSHHCTIYSTVYTVDLSKFWDWSASVGSSFLGLDIHIGLFF